MRNKTPKCLVNNTTLISLRHRETTAGVASLHQSDFADMMATVAAIDTSQKQDKDENASENDIAMLVHQALSATSSQPSGPIMRVFLIGAGLLAEKQLINLGVPIEVVPSWYFSTPVGPVLTFFPKETPGGAPFDITLLR